jgi:hypothetical protein
MPLPFSHFTTAALNSDFRAFRDDLLSRGKTLGSTESDQLYLGARQIYSRYGRVDFLPLGQNVGSGPEAISFHRAVYTRSASGTAWVDEGIQFSGGTLSLPASMSNTVRAGFFVFKTTVEAMNQSIIRIQSGSVSTQYVYLKYDSVTGAGSTASVLRFTRNSVFSDNFSPSRPIRKDQFISSHFHADDSLDALYENGSLLIGGSRTGLAAINPSGAPTSREMGTGLTGTISLGIVFPTRVNTVPLYAIAKSSFCPFLT